MQDQIRAFLRHMEVNRGAARNTIAAYGADLTGFMEFAGEQRPPLAALTVSSIDRNLVEAYAADLRDRSYAPSTVARKVASLRSFCVYLEDHGVLPDDPTTELTQPRPQRPPPTTLSAGEIEELLRIVAATDTLEGKRDAAWIEVMYATGLRVTEIVSLDVGDVDLSPHTAHVRCAAPGRKPRALPLYERARAALEHYLERSRPGLLKNNVEPALFINRRGKRLTRQGLWLIARTYSRRAGIAERVSPAKAAPLVRGSQAERRSVPDRPPGNARARTQVDHAALREAAARRNPDRRQLIFAGRITPAALNHHARARPWQTRSRLRARASPTGT